MHTENKHKYKWWPQITFFFTANNLLNKHFCRSVYIQQLCYRFNTQIHLFSTVEKWTKYATTFQIKLEKTYNPTLLAEVKVNNVRRTSVITKSRCSSWNSPDILHFISASDVFYPIIVHLWNLGKLGLLVARLNL